MERPPLAARRGLGGAAWVLALALGARLAVVAWAASRIPPTADGTFYHTIAARIAQGLGYTWLWPDGAVTYAGHYPVGYPALVAAVYAITGPVPVAAMLLNAVVGALAAVAAYELAERAGGRRVAVAAGVLVAIHPGLVSYTPALMTEGVTASLVVCAAWAAAWARGPSRATTLERTAAARTPESAPALASAPGGALESVPARALASAPDGALESVPARALASAPDGALESAPALALASAPDGASESAPGGASESAPGGASESAPGGASESAPERTASDPSHGLKSEAFSGRMSKPSSERTPSRLQEVRVVDRWYSMFRCAARGEARGWVGALLTGVVLGVATLVRPQSLLLAPIFGWLAVRGGLADGGQRAGRWRRAVLRRGGGAMIALVAALVVCAPWAARNCVRMKRCALVSYNGGWNLLIGADEASTGTWSEIKVPASCREVYDEAEKDACFGEAARRYIAAHPAAWLGLVPRKLAATFDYAGAGAWYLHAASPTAFPERAKVTLGAVETVFERVVLLVALVVGARGAVRALRRKRGTDGERERGRATSGERPRARAVATVVLALPAVASVFWQHVWVAYVLLPLVMIAGRATETAASPRDDEGGRPPSTLLWCTAAVLASLAATHAVFFGAGRYSLVAFPFVTAVAALAFERRGGAGAQAAEGPSHPRS